MAEIVLHYFPLHARAELIRMILHYLNVPFQDHIVQFQEWPELKASGLCEFGQMPCLEMDGLKLVQSNAICRYLAHKYELYPSGLREIYLTESLCDLREDLYVALLDFFKKKDFEGMDKWATENLPEKLKLIEKRLELNDNGNSWFISDKPTLADFVVFEFLYDYLLSKEKAPKFQQLLTESAPKLKAFADRFIESSQTLKAYLESREDKVF